VVLLPKIKLITTRARRHEEKHIFSYSFSLRDDFMEGFVPEGGGVR
jgi:guanylate kinase